MLAVHPFSPVQGETEISASSHPNRKCEVAQVFGLPISCLSRSAVLDAIDAQIFSREPSLIITANLHYAMLCSRQPELQRINQSATFVLADGMPLVWASWLSKKNRLPERITGADLLPAICHRAAQKGHRVFFLGGAPGVGEKAAERLTRANPELQIAGIESPQLSDLSAAAEQELLHRIRSARTDVLFAALGQPRGEFWIAKHLSALQVPVCMQIGASLDFAAGRVSRAPNWVQRSGFEWVYRFACEPGRLGPRYLQNLKFLASELVKGVTCSLLPLRPYGGKASILPQRSYNQDCIRKG